MCGSWNVRQAMSQKVFTVTIFCINTCLQSFSTLISRIVHHTVLKFSPCHKKPLTQASTCLHCESKKTTVLKFSPWHKKPLTRASTCLHCESKKTRHLTLADNFTRYWPIFKILSLLRLGRKFVTKWYINTPPHPKRVATLPGEISVFKKSPFLRSNWSKLLYKT